MSMKPVTDRGEVAIDFPDKAYMGQFGRGSSFDAHADDNGFMLKLSRVTEEKREVEIHLHHFLFADILAELAQSVVARPPIDDVHRKALAAAARALAHALERRTR
ncbi:MAG: hypothetical protein AB7O45_12805 [Alphaproteobacteria bacterium]